MPACNAASARPAAGSLVSGFKMMLVGFTIGKKCTVVPALAETEFAREQ